MIIALCLASLGIVPSLRAYDNAHFYRATNFLYEPRIEREYLTTMDFILHKGSADKGRNQFHDTVPLFNTWGTSDMQRLGIGVPKDLTNVYDLILNDLSLIASRCLDKHCCTCSAPQQFATFSINGEFQIIEGIFDFVQNFKYGLYGELYVPMRQLRVTEVCRCDNSPQDNIYPNINTPLWQTFKNNFDNILALHNLHFENVSESGIGDACILLGWTRSFQNIDVLDFVDLDLALGVLIPSGAKKDQNQVFSLPLGYDGHTGAIINAELAFGAFDWLDLGMYFDTIVFGSKKQCIRIKTGQYQSGIIKLALTECSIEKGTQWQAGGYLKFDHFARGLSILFGYSFVNQNSDEISPEDPEEFSPGIANSDDMIQGWKMHTITFGLEYDFAKRGSQFGPRIGFNYNYIAGGERIFLTNTGGGYIGLDIAWDI
jgi:hypothetical protein